MVDLKKITEKIIHFRNERAWQKTNNSKDLALALTTEAVELNKLFLWEKPDVILEKKVKDELADVFIYALLLLEKYDFDLETIVHDKLLNDDIKYPLQSEVDK